MEDDLILFVENQNDDLKKMEDNLNKKMEDNLKKKWKTNESTKINLIGCDTIVNSPSLTFIWLFGYQITLLVFGECFFVFLFVLNNKQGLNSNWLSLMALCANHCPIGFPFPIQEEHVCVFCVFCKNGYQNNKSFHNFRL